MNRLKIEPLNKYHNKKNFDCGVNALNFYLKAMASQHSKRGISRTYVLCPEDNCSIILGYVTVTACEIDSGILPDTFAKRYPSKIAGAKIGRLAISKPYQKQGLGEHLVSYAMHQSIIVHNAIGIAGMIVDAKDDQAKEYYKKFGFIAFPNQPLTLFLPIKSILNAFNS